MNTTAESTTPAARTNPRVSYSSRKTIEQLAKYVLLIGFGLLFAFPFAWLVLPSLKTPAEILQMPPTLFPQEWHWEN
jgi:multiple sugar transport system permease protein